MYNLFILLIVLDVSMSSLEEFFKLTLMMPNINKTMSNQSIYIAMKLPIDEELYIVDFHPIYNRQKVQFITTYLCSKPYLTKENFWFDYQPCYNADKSMIIYEWYYNIPAVKWPKESGFQVGINTVYRYVVIHIRYFQFDINDKYGQQITIARIRPKYKIGAYKIVTNSEDFSCRYHSSSMQIFSIQFYTNSEGRSISLYRIRTNQLQSIIKGNLHWPQTFYQLQNSIDIQTNDYLIGACIYEDIPLTQTGYVNRDIYCQITIMFWVKEEDKIASGMCWNNYYPRIVKEFLPVDEDIPPQTLFDINPTYPKLSPDEWSIMKMNTSLSPSKSMVNKTNMLFLTYLNDNRLQEIFRLIYWHKLLFIFSLWAFAILIGFSVLLFVIIQSRTNKKYSPKKNNRTKSIIVGGETSSLSGWLTKRRFQQYDQDDDDENKPLTGKHRWASASEESDMSDNEVFEKTNFQNGMLRN